MTKKNSKRVISIALAALVSIVLVSLSYRVLHERSLKGGDIAESIPVLESGDVVTLKRDGYHPDHFKVKKGTSITFKTELPYPHWPASNNHPDHTLYPEFDPMGPVAADKPWSFTFDKPGKWGFHDHLRSPYQGLVEVLDENTN